MKWTLWVVLNLLIVARLAAAQTSPAPEDLVTRVEVSLHADRHNAHVAEIPARGPLLPGGRSLRLHISPMFNSWAEVVVWNVELFWFGVAERDRRNLLEPLGTWRGLQPFHIVPGDVTGANVFPARRVIERRGFTCTIEVLGGVAKQSEESDWLVFESLRLAVEVVVKRSALRAPGGTKK